MVAVTGAKRPRGRPRKHPLPAPTTKSPDPAVPPKRAEGLPVTIHFQRKVAAFGDPPIPSAEVSWPKDWPLPQSGDQVRVGTQMGFVTHVAYLPLEGKIVVNTR